LDHGRGAALHTGVVAPHRICHQWITEVAPLCTSAWLRHIESATNGSSVVTVARRPHIVETFPSSAPRGEVGVTVLLTTGPGSAEDTIYVDLVKIGGRYLVAAAQ